jgi:hypothetical protein
MEIENIIDEANATAAETFRRWVAMRTMEDARNLVKMPPMPPDHLQEAISTIIEAFRMADQPARRAIAFRVNEYLQGRLLGYATDMASLAIRRNAPDCVAQGLMALAIEGGREELRDSITALAMLYHSAVRLNMDAVKAFAEAATLATPGDFATAMSRFPFRPPENRDLAAFYLAEANNEDGFSYEQLPWWKDVRRRDETQ